MIKLKQLMTPFPYCLEENALLSEAAEVFDKGAFHHLPVLSGEECVGLLSKTDYHQLQDRFTRLGYAGIELKNQRFMETVLVRDVMSKELVTLDLEDDISKALDIFLENRVHSILIFDSKRLVGIVTSYDLARYCKRLGHTAH